MNFESLKIDCLIQGDRLIRCRLIQVRLDYFSKTHFCLCCSDLSFFFFFHITISGVLVSAVLIMAHIPSLLSL